jgi:WD40 repeat protein
VSCSVRKLGNDELQIAVGSEDGKAHILLFDGASLTKDVQTLAKHRDVVSCVSFSPTGDYLLTGSGDKTLQLWASSGKNSAFKHIKQFSGHSKGVKDCSWNPTGGWFASSSQDRYIMTWSVTSPGNGPIASVMAHSDNVEAIHVAQLPDGQRVVVTGSWDRSVKLWNASPDGTKLTLLGSYAGTSHFVNTVEILSSCSKLAVGSPDHTVRPSFFRI